jgi:O-glycosyl hydrolase
MFAFVFTTCEDLDYSTSQVAVDAEYPTITIQPVGGTYTLGGSGALTVTATTKSGGSLKYQWYIATDEQHFNDSGDPINGATGASFTINLQEEGVYQIYVKVTNPGTGGATAVSVNSVLVRVILNDPNNAPYPEIISDPKSMAYEWDAGLTVDEISVSVKTPDKGALSYQWYSSPSYSSGQDSEGNEVGLIITGATQAAYKPTISAAGTYFYYVKVTNTWADAEALGGRKESVTYSSPAAVKALEPNATITVNTAQKQQYVRGFGVMAPFWGNAPQDKMSDYELMYNPDKLGYNILRIMIPVSESTSIKTTMDRVLKNELSGEKDRKHYYEMVKVVNGYNGYVLASPWSPPPSWKTNESIKGGQGGKEAKLLKAYWEDYADYLKEYCKIMYEKGAPIYAVSIQNEPNYAADYDGCEWTGPEMRDFFKMVGRFTEGVKGWGGGREIPTVLTMNGESANTPTLNNEVLNDPAAHQYVDIFARHIYGNAAENVSARVQALKDDEGNPKEIWMTEYNINSKQDALYPFDSTYEYVWKFMNSVDLVIRLNNENAYIWWYGRRFYSQIGDGDFGTVGGAILPRGYALSHYAKFATDTDRVGLTFTGTNKAGGPITAGTNFNNTSFTEDSTAVKASAFASRDGNSISLVLFTPTATTGAGGTDMGDIKIEFPAGFTATKVTAMRTKKTAMGKPDGETVLLKGGNAAFISLPAGEILSVKFTR